HGAGHVGAAPVRHLLDAGATVTVADIHADWLEPLQELGAAVVPAEQIHQVECDVYSPCALGAVIRPETIGRLRCRVIAGAANNQLADAAIGDELQQRGMVYAPDFAINTGGELGGRVYDAERARQSVERIEQTLGDVFERSRRDGVAPHRAAEQMA